MYLTGKLPLNYKHGRLCRIPTFCIDCGVSINRGCKRCQKCYHSSRKGIKRLEHSKWMKENNPMKGKCHSDGAKIKMSITRQGMYNGKKNPMFGISLGGKLNGMFGK